MDHVAHLAALHGILPLSGYRSRLPPSHSPLEPIVGLFGRRSRSGREKPGTLRTGGDADLVHLRAFAAARAGVEGFIEPQTLTTATTLVLVAGDGEWTRRRIADVRAAHQLGKELAIPVYDVAATGYPKRMREWSAARKAAGESRSH